MLNMSPYPYFTFNWSFLHQTCMDDVSYNTLALEGYMLNLNHTIWMFDEVYVF